MVTNPRTAAFPWTTIPVDPAKLGNVLRAQMAAGIGYGLGSKAPTLSATPNDYRAIDCSGEVRLLLYQASDGRVVFPDGSVVQHDAVRRSGFKPSTFDDAHARDGIVRIAFLSPEQGGGVGHVLLILDGHTLESFGHNGPGSRPWGSHAFMRAMAVYVLTPPVAR